MRRLLSTSPSPTRSGVILGRMNASPSSENSRIHSPGLAASGALIAAIAIALAAYATHGLSADPQAQSRLQQAALYALFHGIALAGLGRLPMATLARWSCRALLLGTLLFSGSLAGAALWHTPTALAPMGGTLLMLGWLLYAVASLREKCL